MHTTRMAEFRLRAGSATNGETGGSTGPSDQGQMADRRARRVSSWLRVQ